jgi:hypothetical protein
MWCYVTEYFEGLGCLQKHQEPFTPHSINESLIQHVTWMTSWTHDAERVILLSQTAVCPSRWKLRLYQFETTEPSLFVTYLYHALPGQRAKAALHKQWPLPIKYELYVPALKFLKYSYISLYIPCTNCIKCTNNQEAKSICPHVQTFNFQNYWMDFIKFCSGIQHQKSSNKFGSSSYSSTVSTQNISIWYSIYVTKI